jgi:prepilin-type N-terminal cleavage/methylation domain-containing protein
MKGAKEKTLTKVPSSHHWRVLRGSRAFTLIELLVVLVMISLMGAFVGPNLWKQYARTAERGEILGVYQYLLDERKRAYKQGITTIVNSDSRHVQRQLPDGWVLESQEPITFLPSGVTSGGKLVFKSSSGTQWQLILTPLDGKAVIERI